MPSSTSNITTAKRTRRSNKQHRHRYEFSHVLRYPSFANIFQYVKHFFFKSSLGRLVLMFMFVSIFNLYFFSQIYWPKIRSWLNNSTTTAVNNSSEESFVENEL